LPNLQISKFNPLVGRDYVPANGKAGFATANRERLVFSEKTRPGSLLICRAPLIEQEGLLMVRFFSEVVFGKERSYLILN